MWPISPTLEVWAIQRGHHMWYLCLNSLRWNRIRNLVPRTSQPHFRAQLPHVASDMGSFISLDTTARGSTHPLVQTKQSPKENSQHPKVTAMPQGQVAGQSWAWLSKWEGWCKRSIHSLSNYNESLGISIFYQPMGFSGPPPASLRGQEEVRLSVRTRAGRGAHSRVDSGGQWYWYQSPREDREMGPWRYTWKENTDLASSIESCIYFGLIILTRGVDIVQIQLTFSWALSSV